MYVKAFIVNVSKSLKPFFLEQHINIVDRVTLQSFWFISTFIIIGGSIISLSRPYPARDTRYRWIYKRCSIVVSVSE